MQWKYRVFRQNIQQYAAKMALGTQSIPVATVDLKTSEKLVIHFGYRGENSHHISNSMLLSNNYLTTNVGNCTINQWLKWKTGGGGNCRLRVGPLLTVVGPTVVVTGPHGQSLYEPHNLALGKYVQLIGSHIITAFARQSDHTPSPQRFPYCSLASIENLRRRNASSHFLLHFNHCH